MNWLLQLPNGLQAALALGAVATLILLFVSRLSAAALSFAAPVGPIVGALLVACHPTTDSFAVLLLLAAMLCCELLTRSDELAQPRHRAECAALQLLGAAGACVLATATDWLSLLIGFESMSLVVAVLAGIGRGPRSLEVAFRFFVLSAIAAATLVYGIALHAYATGSFALGAPVLGGAGMATMATAAVVMAALGIAFELAIVPSHLGALGVCFAAPLGCVTFAMTVSKIAAALAMVRLASLYPAVQPVLLGLALLTIVWSTLGGLAQQTVRGLLAYSAIGHGGFLALAVGCGEPARGTVAYYAIVYAASVALVLAALSGTSTEMSLAELAKRPMGRVRRLALVFGLLSLAGVPPSPGFLAKLAVLTRSWDAAGPVATLIAALAAVFGALFYLRPVPDLLTDREPEEGAAVPFGPRLAIGVAVVVALLCMVAPQLAIRMAS